MAGAANGQPRLQDPAPQSGGTLCAWARAASINCDQLEISDELAVRGVVAKQTIPGKAAVVRTPRNLILSVVAGQRCTMSTLVPEKLWEISDE